MIMEFSRTAHKEWRTARSGGVKVIKQVCMHVFIGLHRNDHTHESRVFPEVWAHGHRRLGRHAVDAQYLCEGGES